MSDAKEARTLGYSVDTSNPSEAWKKVREAVTTVDAGGVITLSGTINATNAPGNRGQIEISKNLTIQGAPGNSPAVLDAHHLGSASITNVVDSHRIFTVTGAVDVTLQDLTLRNGKDTMMPGIPDGGGGGIWALATANLTLINVTVENCITKTQGGGIQYYYHLTGGGRLTMKNCTIKNNTVKDDGSIGGSSTGGGISLPWASYTAVIDGCTIAGNKIDMSAKTGSAPRLEAEGCGLACSATSSSITIIKGHTVIKNNQCIPHALKPCECKGMGIFCGGGPLTIGETGKDNDESPEILNHGNPIPTNVTVAGTALYIKIGGTVRWLRGRIHDNGTDPNNSIKNAGGNLDNQTGNGPS